MGRQWGDLDMQVNTVQQRATDARLVAGYLVGRAAASAQA